MPISLPPSPTPSLVQPPPRNRSSSGAVHGETSTPRMLRGRPSPLRPQRSMATAWLTPASRHVPIRRSRPVRSSMPTSSTVTATPVSWTAARTAPTQGVSTAIRAGTSQAASAAASRAVPTGPSVSGAATSPRGTKKPVIRPTRLASASASAAAASPPALATISSWVLRPTSRQTSASMAAMRRTDSLLLGDIHSRPIGRRIVDQPIDPHAHHVVVALPPTDGSRGGLAACDQVQRLDEAAGPVLRPEGRLLPHQLVIGRRLRLGKAADQGMDALRFGLALDHDQVDLQRGVVVHLQARLVADDDADTISFALPFDARCEIHVLAQARIG